jgi:hypothetical protein
MKKSLLFLAFILILLITTLPGCAIVGGIFKVGVVSGIAIVVAVIAVIAILLTRVGKDN